MLSTIDQPQTFGHIRSENEGLGKILHASGNQKKAGFALFASNKMDFKIKAVKRDKEGHYLMIKGSIQEEYITIINIYAPNLRAPQYIRQMLTTIKGEINSGIIIVGNFNTLHTPMNKSSR